MGNFTVVETFHGSNSYWPSWSEISFAVMEKPEGPPTAAPLVTEMYFVPAVVAIIVVIIIVGAVLAILMLRKRP